MFPWLWLWAPQYHFPWSGSVAQRIEPNTNWFFDAIDAPAGNGRIEKKAFEVASYGKQLGLITDLLIDVAQKCPALSADAADSLARLAQIRDEIEQVKQRDAAALVAEFEHAFERLRRADPAQHARMATRLRGLLGEQSAS